MDVEGAGESALENLMSCSCKSTFSTKWTGNTNHGFPCKTAGVACGSDCSCRSTAKPCRNQPGGGVRTPSTQRRPQPYQAENRPSEEEERIKENNDVKEFVQTLDQAMVLKLCIRSLRRGIGSMDYIHGLLIIEGELDDEIGRNERSVSLTPGTSTEEQMACTSEAATPDPGRPPGNTSAFGFWQNCCPGPSCTNLVSSLIG